MLRPRLPSWMAQPFNLSFAPDDLHVMAYLADHPLYEAVEAMIRLRVDRPPLVRAILTHHDQSQVDHSNDEERTENCEGDREQHFCAITCVRNESQSSHRVLIQFTSYSGEHVELDVTSLGMPSAERGGLSDPGEHSLSSSLPIMLRGRSALASPQSRVSIDGRAFTIPIRIEAAGKIIALKGFFTEVHHMAALRSGVVRLELLDMPAAFRPGECWVYKSSQGLATYRISRLSDSGAIEVTRLGAHNEWIRGTVANDAIELSEVRVSSLECAHHFVSLRFENQAFGLDVDGVEGLVRGAFEGAQDDEAHALFALVPASLSWSVARRVTVDTARMALGQISVQTTIG